MMKRVLEVGTTVTFSQTTAREEVRLSLSPNGSLSPLLDSPFNEYAAALSPDGRWLAYQSNESGRPEVYVRDLSGSGGRWQISNSEGEEPRWSRDGRKLFFRSGGTFFAVEIETSPAFRAGVPRMLFKGIFNFRSNTGISYDVAPSGDRFLMLRPADENAAPAQIRVVINWKEELRRLTASQKSGQQ